MKDIEHLKTALDAPCCGFVHLNGIGLEELFGEYYQYNFPKWCKENGYICMYRPQSLEYVVFNGEYRTI